MDESEHEAASSDGESAPVSSEIPTSDDMENLSDIEKLEKISGQVDIEPLEPSIEKADRYLFHPEEYREPDRPRGILSERDRRYLLDKSRYEGSQERVVRLRIRERLYHALLDFTLLANQLGEDDARRVFKNLTVDPEAEEVEVSDEDLFAAIQNTMIFLVAMMEEQGIYAPAVADDAVTRAYDLLQVKHARDASLYASFVRIADTLSAGLESRSEPSKSGQESSNEET